MKKKIVAKENSGKLMCEVLVHDDLTRKTLKNLTTADALFCIKRAVH